MKDAILTYLEKYNQTNDLPITRLYFAVDGKRDFVEDYTYFINCMSDELKAALSNGKTLTSRLQYELDGYRIEKIFN